jgi:3',5'-cyclic AMP phosphodiesterase CpdA
MKKAVPILTALAVIISLLILPAGAAPFTASTAPDHIALTWSGDPATTQTIQWRTDTTVTAGYVQYAVAPAAPANGLQAEATVKTLETELGKQNIFAATLTGLASGVKYSYRVGDGLNWSGAGTFTTAVANTQSFKFLIYGDSQANTQDGSVSYTDWQKTLPEAYKANPDAKFMLSLGDNVDWGSSGDEWDQWFAGARGIIDAIPMMSVVGNHEVINTKGYTTQLAYNTMFTFPQNGPDTLKNQTYSFNYGNIHFVALDSQSSEEAIAADKPNPDVDRLQAAWLEQDLAANKLSGNTKWTIVLMHKPLYCNRGSKSNEALKLAYQPIFDKYNVDVVLDAHDHSYSRTYPMYNDSPVSSTAKGTVYIEAGRIGVKAFPESSARIWNAFFYDPQDQANYMTAEVSGMKLTFKCFKTDGTLIDCYTIDKATGKDSPQTVPPGRCPTPRMAIYGQLIQLPQLSANPVKKGDVWYVPVRCFTQFAGGTVTWNSADASVTLAYGKTTAVIRPNTADATVNGKPVTLLNIVTATAAGVTLVPADDMKTLLGFKYKYDPALNVLFFTT